MTGVRQRAQPARSGEGSVGHSGWLGLGRGDHGAVHGHQREHRALKTPDQRHGRRSVGTQVSVIDHVEDPLDQVGGLSSLGLGQCHYSIMPEEST
jgi:hypothetical protein